MKKEKKTTQLLKLGSAIRLQRNKIGITQEELALTSELDRSYVGGIERGERNISFLTLVKIAKSLKCSISDLTEGIK